MQRLDSVIKYKKMQTLSCLIAYQGYSIYSFNKRQSAALATEDSVTALYKTKLSKVGSINEDYSDLSNSA